MATVVISGTEGQKWGSKDDFVYWNIILIKKYKVSTYFRNNNLATKRRMGWRE